jgi:hypothetical protein
MVVLTLELSMLIAGESEIFRDCQNANQNPIPTWTRRKRRTAGTKKMTKRKNRTARNGKTTRTMKGMTRSIVMT